MKHVAKNYMRFAEPKLYSLSEDTNGSRSRNIIQYLLPRVLTSAQDFAYQPWPNDPVFSLSLSILLTYPARPKVSHVYTLKRRLHTGYTLSPLATLATTSLHYRTLG